MCDSNDNHCFIQRIYYRPIEAAIRWAGLIDQEREILHKINHHARPVYSEIASWPTVFLCNERIFDAIINKELPCGKNGVTCDIAYDDHDLTVKHIDLKRWIHANYPFDKPAFLFDEAEREITTGINLHALQHLLANNYLLKQSVHQQVETIQNLEEKNLSLKENPLVLKERSESTYLSIIGAMLDILVSNIPAHFTSQESIIDTLLTQYPGYPGLSERTLKSKFAAAKRKISTKPF
ncbi:hypothetical protein CUZ56_00263 [Saezia sanguinis]|uniref:Uncharacterized protein n=1 Tax=Saezia sanguinis TaxID=1965230 RepID=A0A433SGH1_9BURK|nr:hypothetical protein [Saezia sanguinis]RUS67786.1 hypothetical protein CUZ56_00263 [Saezia sanguinis]